MVELGGLLNVLQTIHRCNLHPVAKYKRLFAAVIAEMEICIETARELRHADGGSMLNNS